ncbi:hypothetical protein PFICI_03369 [Pestalotiopsis fici W106-1]|uniref:Heterokaryon incompatibility domain-containing protein n=1 Tax=Pestalotiopsis fici (strain W106-1 / CGMCC3.15140) TaxID=1229662 RepID=W3XH73_PESFW|nr:uncharacterized protein PFICI_03369 [Pestalotiopsis fici W106-1]ETS85344.1 hypothetical protein PFICI_03369 [Pestalotiopsis fici W106-1]
MLRHRIRFLRGIGPRASVVRPQTLPKPNQQARLSHTNGSNDQEPHEIERLKKAIIESLTLHIAATSNRSEVRQSRWTLLLKWLKIYFCLAGAAHLAANYAYEPLRDHGIFDNVVDRTVFCAIPPDVLSSRIAADDAPYQPITQDNEIRLLILEPGVPGDEIRCYLVNVDISWGIRYEALSYAWGDATITRGLTCSGRVMEVHASLHDALSDLRHPTRRRRLWVDGLCINQADEAEKGQQVKLMGDIYSRARQVLIYLGKSDTSVEGAMQFIRRLDRVFMFTYFGNSEPAKDTLFRLKNPINMEEKDWEQIVHLLLRPWFRRTWVFQETVLPQHGQVICGDQSIPWAQLQRFVIAMGRYNAQVKPIPNYKLVEDAVNGVLLVKSARQVRHPKIAMPNFWPYPHRREGAPTHHDAQCDPKLLDLILESRSFMCTDPRDKVFGMLGVTGQNIRSEYIDPRYGYSMSAMDVFRRFVLWEIIHNGSLRVLGSSSDKAGSQDRSPSWVPDFTRLDSHYLLTGRIISDRQDASAYDKAHSDVPERYDASAGSSVQAWTSDQETVLHLKGLIVDALHTVGQKSADLPNEDFSHKGYGGPLKLRREWYNRLQINKDMIKEAVDIWVAAMRRQTQGHGPFHDTEGIMALTRVAEQRGDEFRTPPSWRPFLQTLIGDPRSGGTAGDEYDIERIWSLVRLTLQGPLVPRWYLTERGYGVDGILPIFLSMTKSRRFAGTDMGLIGYVPFRAQKGDLVCILYGADVPFVLRKLADGRYSLVGECYMNGIMYGEALATTDAKDQDVVFTIV